MMSPAAGKWTWNNQSQRRPPWGSGGGCGGREGGVLSRRERTPLAGLRSGFKGTPLWPQRRRWCDAQGQGLHAGASRCRRPWSPFFEYWDMSAPRKPRSPPGGGYPGARG